MSRPWRLRGYVVERLLGTGATGEVWRARVAATGEPVALKRLVGGDGRSQHRRSGGRQQERLHTEAALLSALEHPHLIRLHGVERDADGDVLVLDLADGGSLADVLRARGRLTPGEVITALTPIGSALAYAHGEGVVHGDVSAGNVLFTAGGVALLADLGVGRLIGDEIEAESTPSYVDPAVAVGCVPGPSGDVFMLGGVALHALTGEPTWPGDTATALAAARNGDPGDVAARLAAAGVPSAMAQVVCRALAPDPADRGNAADFALDLRYSGDPVAVELRAGRARRDAVVRAAREAAANARDRPRAGRHAAPDTGTVHGSRAAKDAGGPPAPRLPWRALTDFGTPPAGLSECGGTSGSPPTASVQPRPRPRLPRHRRIAPAARRVGMGASALLLVGGVVSGGVWLHSRPPAATSTAATARVGPRPDRTTVSQPPPSVSSLRESPVVLSSTTPVSSLPSTTPVSPMPSAASPPPLPSATSPPPLPSATSPPPLPSATSPPASPAAASGAMAPAAVLRRLDAVRGRAYARRRPTLLARVYASRRLLRADRVLLTSLVPTGCALTGLRTRYTEVRTSSDRFPMLVSAVASVGASQLRCRGRPARTAPAPAPAAMRIRLVRSRDGPRIAAEWRAATR